VEGGRYIFPNFKVFACMNPPVSRKTRFNHRRAWYLLMTFKVWPGKLSNSSLLVWRVEGVSMVRRAPFPLSNLRACIEHSMKQLLLCVVPFQMYGITKLFLQTN
jgi:hypothetical protein